MLQVVVGTSWRAMVPELAAALRNSLTSPFSRGLVVVDSAGSGRLLSQSLAEIDGIAAGVETHTVSQLTAQLAATAGVAEQWTRWRGSRLVTALAEVVEAVASEYAPLEAFIREPGRKLSACANIARLFQSYMEQAPSVTEQWLAGDDGHLPPHLEWQPALLRAACDQLGFNPVEVFQNIIEAAGTLQTPTWLFGVDEVAPVLHPLIEALSPRSIWCVGREPDWLDVLPHDAPVAVGKPLRATPTVEIHGSHSRLRQAEVLRDELTRYFELNPGLEPRDVRIVCPDPDAWAPVLNAVFRPTGSHPGSALRVADVRTSKGGNHAIEAVLAALELVDGRATANAVVEFLLSPGIADRWGFANQREDLLELVDAAQIRWGLTRKDRNAFGLPDIATNTWESGIDALLTGIAMGGVAGPRGVLGVERTTSNDLDLIGALAEIVGRLWELREASTSELTVTQWCDVAVRFLDQLVGLNFEDRWMQQQAAAYFCELARSHVSSTALLRRRDFCRLLQVDMPSMWHRPALGNGQLHVVAPHEARHVDAGLVVMIGLDDGGRKALLPDALPGLLPDPRRSTRQYLQAQASSARHVLIVTQTRSERTNASIEMPVTIRHLLRQLGIDVPDAVQHAPQPFNPSAFSDPATASFDETAFDGARATTIRLGHSIEERRRLALQLPIADPVGQLSVTKLKRFLADPAKELLSNLASIHPEDELVLDDVLPLDVAGLTKWKITDQFVSGRLDHVEPQTLLRRAEQSQRLPPGPFGRALAADLGRQADAVVVAAQRLMSEQPDVISIDVMVGDTRLTGSAQMHGSRIVVASASSGSQALLEPWLQVLALAVQGVHARAVVIRPGRYGPRQNELSQPAPHRAKQLLQLYLHAHTIGRSRLLPVPFDPAFSLVMEQHRGKFNRSDWMRASSSRDRKWRYPEPHWELFFNDPAAELLDTMASAEDPPGDADSCFERWASALYQPLVEHGGSW